MLFCKYIKNSLGDIIIFVKNTIFFLKYFACNLKYFQANFAKFTEKMTVMHRNYVLKFEINIFNISRDMNTCCK